MRLSEIINEDKSKFIQSLKGNQKIIDAYNENTRNLDIRGEPTTLGTWERIMSQALADSDGYYNEFHARSVAIAFRDAIFEMGIGEDEIQFIPGREGSVVLYVTGPYEYLEELGNYISKNREEFKYVDELNLAEDGGRRFNAPVLRLWWD